MPSVREIQRKIKSVKQTQQVTKTMKMIAASRLKRAQGQLLASRPYAQKIEELVMRLHERLKPLNLSLPALLEPRPAATMRLAVLFTSDKGLCGSYNITILRQTLKYLEQAKAENHTVRFLVIGKKGRDFLSSHQFSIEKEYVNYLRRPSFAQAEVLGQEIMRYYLDHQEVSRVDVIYMDFRSVIRQTPAIYGLIPPTLPPGKSLKEEPLDYLYEPAREKILAELLPRYVNTQLYHLIFESYTSEQASRMNVMENATKNAGDVIDALSLEANKVRQASITRELLEVVSGAEALT
ncbi:MAG: ATP synthase F1 subunit gamma [Elusimicrobia bacterium]|nr:ATP synthase F1 subunit gamma [Elusimicrobiota bacterium]